MVSCKIVSTKGDKEQLTDPVSLRYSVDGTLANKETERTPSGEKGAVNKHSKGEPVGRVKARRKLA
jgi:hypothetical protein